LWTFLLPGRSKAPNLFEENLTSGVRRKEETEDTRKRIKYLSIVDSVY